MAGRGFSLHVAVNSPFPQVFPSLAPIRGCDAAARAMADIARAERFADVRLHLDRQDTRVDVVAAWFAGIASVASAGDLVVFTFAGHGIRVNIAHRPSRASALACADGAIAGTTLHAWLAAFRRGVRVVLIVDACYSGGLLSGAVPVAADVLLLAASRGDRTAPAAGRGDTSPPFSRTLIVQWNAGNGSIAGGYVRWCEAAGGVLDAMLPNDRALGAQAPFRI